MIIQIDTDKREIYISPNNGESVDYDAIKDAAALLLGSYLNPKENKGDSTRGSIYRY